MLNVPSLTGIHPRRPRAASWDDRMFMVITINFHHEHCIAPTSCPRVPEDNGHSLVRTAVQCLGASGILKL